MIQPSKTILPDTDAQTPQDPDGRISPQQADILRALCEEAGEDFDDNLTQAQAAERIGYLRDKLEKDD